MASLSLLECDDNSFLFNLNPIYDVRYGVGCRHRDDLEAVRCLSLNVLFLRNGNGSYYIGDHVVFVQIQCDDGPIEFL